MSSGYEGMRVTIDIKGAYDGVDYRWKVVSDGDVGFYMMGREETYRRACREAKRAMKKLAGIGFLPYQSKKDA